MNLLAIPLALMIVSAGGSGTAILPLMKIGQGPRAAAMGESFTGLADDASAIYWNPAGLGQLSRYQFSLSHHEWFAGIRDEVFHMAVPAGPGTFGLGAVYTGEPNVQYWDEQTMSYGTCRTWTGMLTAGYGLRLLENYELGIAAKGLYEDLRDQSGVGGGVDVGVIGRPMHGLGIGLAARHLGGISMDGQFEPLPMELAAGASLGAGPLRMTLDAVFPLLDNDPNFRAGVEYSPISAVALRVGYRTGPVHLASLGYLSGLTAGLGVAVGGIGIDYAFMSYGELGLTHRIGIRTAPARTDAGLTVIVLDAENRTRLEANLAVSGVASTSAFADILRLTGLKPGSVHIRATRDEYEPQTHTAIVVAGEHRQDTILLRRQSANIIGGIYDARTRRPIGGALAYSGTADGRMDVAPTPGTFEIRGATPGTYELAASGPQSADYWPQTASVDVPAGQTVRQDFFLIKRVHVLEGVNFETGKADILPMFIDELDYAGQILVQMPGVRVELAGHTDPRDINTNEFPSNWELSDARAKAVRDYFIKNFGIDPARLATKGYADTEPVVPNTSPENMFMNRRTEIRILD